MSLKHFLKEFFIEKRAIPFWCAIVASFIFDWLGLKDYGWFSLGAAGALLLEDIVELVKENNKDVA